MKIVSAVLQWLMLASLTLSQDSCNWGGQASYYIYNGNVKINSYYSFLSDGNSPCKNIYNGKRVTNGYQEILTKYRQLSKQKCKEINSKTGAKITFCEVPAQVNLLGNKITLVSKKICEYNVSNCYDEKLKSDVFWDYKEKCQNLILMHNGSVEIGTIGRNRMKFIQFNSHNSLLLKKRTELCGVEVWNTRHNGIVVSTNYINSVKGSLLKFSDITSTVCNDKANTNDETIGQNTWYIYKYITIVTVYYCISNYKPCNYSGYDEISQSNQQNLSETCKNKFSNFKPTNSKVCQKTQTVDFEKDVIQGLPSNCTYSIGICRKYKAFWNRTDHCSAIQNVHKGYEVNNTEKNRRIQITDSFKLTLLEQGNLCDKPIWYTNQQGFVASPKELQFFQSEPIAFPNENADRLPEVSQRTESSVENMPSDNQDHLASSEEDFNSISNTALPLFVDQVDDNRVYKNLDIQDQEINHLQNLVYLLMVLVLVCVLWYIVNVIVNCISLKRLSNTRISKNRAYIFNCVSHSLTVRYLFVNEKKVKTEESIPGVNESVDNELYDMGLTKFK